MARLREPCQCARVTGSESPLRMQLSIWRLPLLLPFILLLQGCLTLAAVQRGQEEQAAARLAPFNIQEHAWSLAAGAPVTGAVVLDTMWTETSYGRPLPAVRKVLTCEGRLVRLIPDTEHMRWRLGRHWLRVEEQGYWSRSSIISSPDWSWPAESRAVVRETTCGVGGTFRFDDVPDGSYLVLALIPAPQEWEATPDVVLKPVRVSAEDGAAHVDVRMEDSWLKGAVVRH